MIGNLIAIIFFPLFAGILAILPTASEPALNSQVSEALNWIFGFAGMANNIIDVPTLFLVAGLALTIEFLMLGWHLAVWIYGKIPFKFT